MIRKLGLLVVALIVTICPSVFGQDFSGIWSCDDGGTYYIHQLGNTIWWFGENNPNNPDIANVANGAINGDKISLNWADVPKGTTNNYGVLVLKIESKRKLQKIQSTGGFNGTTWTYNSANTFLEFFGFTGENETSHSMNAAEISNQMKNAQQNAKMRMWAIQAETNFNQSNRNTGDIKDDSLHKSVGINETNKTPTWEKWEKLIQS